MARKASGVCFPWIPDYGIVRRKITFYGGCEMRNVFMCSLCHNGILGGGLYLDHQAVTFRTQKLTVSEQYRNLILPLNEIKGISWKWIVFPVATFSMKNREQYKFIIFNKWRFQKIFREYFEHL